MTWKLLAGLVDVRFKSELILKRRSKDDEVDGRRGGVSVSDYFDAERMKSRLCSSLGE